MKQILILLGGITTSILTVIAVFIIQYLLDTDITSWMYFFIIPVGSGLAGAASASGYYFASRITNTAITKSLLLNMLFISLSTYFLIEWITYNTMILENGLKVKELA